MTQQVKYYANNLPPQVARINIAPWAHFLRGIAPHQSRAAQAIKTRRAGTRLSAKNAANDFRKLFVLCEKDENTPQMIAENPFIAVRSRFEFLEAELASGQFVEAAPDQVRLAAQQTKELVHFAVGSQRR